MSKLREKFDGTNEPIYDDCDDCGEMLIITQCNGCKKWLCNRCWTEHYCLKKYLGSEEK